jgi:hypothetical protein
MYEERNRFQTLLLIFNSRRYAPDRLRITCSLARKGIAILIAKGMIRPVAGLRPTDPPTMGPLTPYNWPWPPITGT